MDRHVDFATQLSCLVELYAHRADDKAAERTVLRSARAAAKHGAIALSVADRQLQAGTHTLGDDIPNVPMLRDLFVALGIARIDVEHQAKQAEIKSIAHLLAGALAGKTAPEAFAKAIAARKKVDIRVALDVEAPGAEEDEPPAAPAEPEVTEPEAAKPEAPVDRGPLATHVPAAVEQLAEPRHREFFERLITSSEPDTLRRLLEPIQLAVEQSLREGRVAEALHLLLAMIACEGLSADPEMRRNFVVVVRRLTKPTVLRAFAMLYADEPQYGPQVEQVLARFGEDGAEAVADRVRCARSAAARSMYAALLGRLPGGRDAAAAMLDDQRPHVVESAIGLVMELRLPDAERELGERIGHESVRVRRAAAQGLAGFPDSTFAADALLRALLDAAPEVRLTAAVALRARRETRLVQPIVQRLDEEHELDVQLALVAALGRLAATEGVHKLIALATADQRALRRRDASLLRFGAIEALGEARTPQAMLALQKLLEDRDKEVREMAARLFTRARRQTTTGSVASVSEP